MIAGSWLYGSATYFANAMPAPKSDPTTTPVSTSVSTRSWPRTHDPMASTRDTAAMPPANASPWIAAMGRPMKMPATAPSAQPAETPRMSGATSGLRKRFW